MYLALTYTKSSLKKKNALLNQKGGEDNNEQDDNPSRCIISVAKYQYQYVAINYVTIDEFRCEWLQIKHISF